MKIQIAVLAFFFFSFGQSYSQPVQLWAVGAPYTCQYLNIDLAGNSYVAGYYTVRDAPSYTFLQKISSAGNIIYTTGIDTPSALVATFMDSLDNQYAAGYYSGGWAPPRFTVVKCSSKGQLLWRYVEPISQNSNDAIIDMAGNKSGTSYVLRRKAGYNQIASYSSSGQQKFLLVIPDSMTPGKITIDSRNNIYVAGARFYSADDIRVNVVKFSPTGIRLWKTEYARPTGHLYGASPGIKITESGSIYIWYGTKAGTNSDYTILKYDTSGVQQWAVNYDYSQYDAPNSVAFDMNENICIAGTTGLLKFSRNGDFLWIDTTARYSAVTTDKYGNIYLAGAISSGSFTDLAAAKYSGSGIRQWVVSYGNVTFGEAADAIALDTAQNILVAGYQGYVPMPGYTSGVVVKYVQFVGLHQLNSDSPEKFSLSQNYPNPFNPSTKINFEVPNVGNGRDRSVNLVIYDALGRELETLVNENLSAGTYEVTWDASKYSTGFYYYRILAGDYTDTKKMILIK